MAAPPYFATLPAVNYFAHAYPHLDDPDVSPYYLAGLATPDWLGVAARRTKCRTKHVEPFFEDADPRLAALARGVARHHSDDGWFHVTRAFTELSLSFSAQIREALQRSHKDEVNLRPWFLGHILVELLLDSELIAAAPARLDDYYHRIAQVDSTLVAASIERMSGRGVGRLAEFVERYPQVRFLADYADDQRLLFRVNQVMQRVGLAKLPADFAQLLPALRSQVASGATDLMTPSELA